LALFSQFSFLRLIGLINMLIIYEVFEGVVAVIFKMFFF